MEKWGEARPVATVGSRGLATADLQPRLSSLHFTMRCADTREGIMHKDIQNLHGGKSTHPYGDRR